MSYGNITVDPLSFADPALKCEIDEVLDLDSGYFSNAPNFIRSHRYQDLIEARGIIVERMNTNSPHYGCALCGIAVYLVSTPEKRFFFRHRIEDGSCPAQTRSPLSMEEITARKYHGLRESQPHIRIKMLIGKSLAADQSFSDIALEKTWKATGDSKAYRRPDVQAKLYGQKIAFEVQLSTTFLSVVVGRRMFYRNEGALLIWVFGGFDPSYRRLTTDDLLFSNNSNIFCVDDETVERSVAAQAFHLRCHFRRPLRTGDEVVSEWDEAIVAFDALTQDLEGQRTYLFDYQAAEQEIRDQITHDANERATRQIALAEAETEALRQSFFAFWREKGAYMDWNTASIAGWSALRDAFALQKIELPIYPERDAETRAMLNALISVIDGVATGWSFKSLTQVAHHLAVTHPRQLLAFGYAVRHFSRGLQIEKEDASKKMESQEQHYRVSSQNVPPRLCTRKETAANIRVPISADRSADIGLS